MRVQLDPRGGLDISEFSKIILGRTTHLSRDAAKAPELDTSRVMPFSFIKRSCSFSKLLCGGAICRLSTKRRVIL